MDARRLIKTREPGGICYVVDSKGQIDIPRDHERLVNANNGRTKLKHDSSIAQRGSSSSVLRYPSFCPDNELLYTGFHYASDLRILDRSIDLVFTMGGSDARKPSKEDPKPPFAWQDYLPHVPTPGTALQRSGIYGPPTTETVPSLTDDQSSRRAPSSIPDEVSCHGPEHGRLPEPTIAKSLKKDWHFQPGGGLLGNYAHMGTGIYHTGSQFPIANEAIRRRSPQHACNLCTDDMSCSAWDSESPNDSETEDEGSYYMSDYSEDPLEILKGFPELYSCKPLVLQMLLDRFSTLRASLVRCPNASHGGDSGLRETTGKQPFDGCQEGEGSKKRKRHGGEDETAEGGPRELLTTNRKSGRKVKRTLLLACPFYKKDPQRHRVCFRKTLTKISYVKQHLSKHHSSPIYCPVCYLTFDSVHSRDAHVRARRCEERPKVEWGCVTESQRNELKQRVSAKLSEEQQWFKIFGILFPGGPEPRSAYIDSHLCEELCAFEDFAMSRGPGIIRESLQTRGSANDGDGTEPGLTALLDSAIADGIQAMFQRWHELSDLANHARTSSLDESSREAEDPIGASSSGMLTDLALEGYDMMLQQSQYPPLEEVEAEVERVLSAQDLAPPGDEATMETDFEMDEEIMKLFTWPS